MAIHVPILANAIAELVGRGHVELFYGPEGGEVAIVSDVDLLDIISDPSNWWNDVSLPPTALVLTESAGLAPIPGPRPGVY